MPTLNVRTWGNPGGGEAVICVHGVAQHGGIFEPLAQALAGDDRLVLAVDLRGHGDSHHEPPWSIEAQVADLLTVADEFDISRGSWVGHSFGGRLVAELATQAPTRVARLGLLEPALQVPKTYASRQADIYRHDWSFATPEGAANALLSSDSVVVASKETIEAYVADDVRRGPDGRWRFRYAPAAAEAAWREMARPAPAVAAVPTLIVRAERSMLPPGAAGNHREEAAGSLSLVEVPHGHNVLWESPRQTCDAVARFLFS